MSARLDDVPLFSVALLGSFTFATSPNSTFCRAAADSATPSLLAATKPSGAGSVASLLAVHRSSHDSGGHDMARGA
eukprot:CAMPEP_0179272650 /NCGR_PEP_ID=MMETSP0797-20121207/32611_1 /TAXON_ID=47934 /ORGANISM="Dinophysis acuminata, Strain DAEP01" /LENGTH=75 /DNA_ID=CAMNT_0020981061 /DNA_START=472 /DNA_END=696 /DNA_ORIENTATION=-